MASSRAARLAPLLLIVAVFLVLLGHPGISARSRMWRVVLDFGHVATFGVMALVFLRVPAILLDRPRRPVDFAIAWTAAAGLGLATEAFQSIGPRDADFGDLGRDVVGATCALAFVATYGRAWASKPLARFGVRAGAVLGVAVMLIPIFHWAYVFREREAAWPALLRFEGSWELDFVGTDGVQLDVISPPVGWKKPPGEHVARLLFGTSKYPKITLTDLKPDWSPYTSLSFQLFSRLKKSIVLTVKIHDVPHNNRHGDRFNKRIQVRPGLNKIRISLAEVRRAPKHREMDMTQIEALVIFASRPEARFILYLDDMVLQ